MQRLHASGDGWQDLAWVTDESIEEWDDVEHRWGVQESYRVLVVDTDGITSVPPTASTVTKTAATSQGLLISSNVDPTIDTELDVQYPWSFSLPEVADVSASHGRDYQRVHRQSENLGDVQSWVMPN